MLLPFQRKWVTDNSRLKLCVKSRQIGMSWCTAYRLDDMMGIVGCGFGTYNRQYE
jgi:phage FluMu gp28-like protein